jgi:hypothetical protein
VEIVPAYVSIVNWQRKKTDHAQKFATLTLSAYNDEWQSEEAEKKGLI